MNADGTTTVLVTVDSLRYDYVFGDRRDYDLPTIDRLADEGTVFEDAYANAPYTTDSFTSILSGTHPWRYGIESNGFEPDRPHVVEPFEAAGYDTLGVYCNPYLGPSLGYDRGFDQYVEGEEGRYNPLSVLRDLVVKHLPRESVLFQAIRSAQRKVSTTLGVEPEGRPYADAAAVNDAAAEFFTEATGPTFAWLHYMDVHSPFYPHEGTRSESINESEAISTFYETNMRQRDVSEAELDLLEDLYIGEIQYLDKRLGELLDLLEEAVGLQNVTLLFTSDHGEAFDEHGFCFHPKELYQELIRIPLVLWGPESQSNSVDVPVSNVDVLPTLLEDAGLPVPDGVTGTPLQHIERDDDGRRYVFSQAVDEDTQKVMVYDGRYKLVRDFLMAEEQLSDLFSDPGETENRLSDGPANRLRSELETHLGAMETETDPTERNEQEVPESVEQQLEDLGYR